MNTRLERLKQVAQAEYDRTGEEVMIPVTVEVICQLMEENEPIRDGIAMYIEHCFSKMGITLPEQTAK